MVLGIVFINRSAPSKMQRQNNTLTALFAFRSAFWLSARQEDLASRSKSLTST